jgi:hypothetical protein
VGRHRFHRGAGDRTQWTRLATSIMATKVVSDFLPFGYDAVQKKTESL